MSGRLGYARFVESYNFRRHLFSGYRLRRNQGDSSLNSTILELPGSGWLVAEPEATPQMPRLRPWGFLRSAPANQASFPIMGYDESRWSSVRTLKSGDKMKRKDDFILQNVGGENLLVPLGEVMDLNGLVTLNGTGACVWEHLARTSVDELAGWWRAV